MLKAFLPCIFNLETHAIEHINEALILGTFDYYVKYLFIFLTQDSANYH